MTVSPDRDFPLLGEHLAARRETIIEATWRLSQCDPEQTTMRTLTRAQFDDHIPPVLDAFARQLQGLPEPGAPAENVGEAESKHGLHRWQQGYRLRELLHEWGHLHHSVFDELEAFAAEHPALPHETFAEANRRLIKLVNDAISESAGQYARLQQDEALGQLRDLQRAFSQLKEIERSRSRLIHQAVHDLRGNVQSVSSAAEVLRDSDIPDNERSIFLHLLQQGVEAVGAMIGDLMDLARLEAGQERREIAAFDASAMIHEFCSVTLGVARKNGLSLHAEGPASLVVEGDYHKVRRILQNLVLNALKYTRSGGVTVKWAAQDADRWWITIADTGPGLMAGPGAPIAGDLKEATMHARETDEISGLPAMPPSGSANDFLPTRQQPGEGIGLSIVKRLCELLDASIELTSSSQDGTTFRVVLPRRAPAGEISAAPTDA